MDPSSKERFVAMISPYTTSLLHYRKPSVVAWWSAAFPGFGHFMLSKYVTAFILIAWEVVINTLANLNHAIFLSMTGRFNEAIEILEPKWIFVYVSMYIFSIWDSYRLTIEMNKHYTMAYRDDYPSLIANSSSIEVNLIDKKNPLLAAFWSAIIPGLGSLYMTRLVSTVLLITWWLFITYQANVYEALLFSFLGRFSEATEILVPHWLLFIPSIYCFSIYDAYVSSVQINKYIDKFISRKLKKDYQHPSFKMPL
ncbi:MAG: hypothetical protein LPK00_08635 [Bacillaceae bacterium]|nr:hypothetical protein [Bacillaceae bacterium]